MMIDEIMIESPEEVLCGTSRVRSGQYWSTGTIGNALGEGTEVVVGFPDVVAVV